MISVIFINNQKRLRAKRMVVVTNHFDFFKMQKRNYNGGQYSTQNKF